jgi:uncharacterized NAD-dependent epimerase/dehydratase family protein
VVGAKSRPEVLDRRVFRQPGCLGESTSEATSFHRGMRRSKLVPCARGFQLRRIVHSALTMNSPANAIRPGVVDSAPDSITPPERIFLPMNRMSSASSEGADPASATSHAGAALPPCRRMVILTEGASTPYVAKTAISLLRYRGADVIAVLDSTQAGKTCQQLFATGGDIPVVSSLAETSQADSLVIGIAPAGGKLPQSWRSVILDAIQRGLHIVSGLHDFLQNDVEFRDLARKHDVRLVDVRRNDEHTTSAALDFRAGCLRIHTVGHDCSVGKMVTALEVDRGLRERGLDALFLATGQTGIMISGDGTPIDCVVGDFISGAAERLVARHQEHDYLLIEGQGSLAHPLFSAVTLGLLHGCAPDGLILCYEAGRDKVKGLDHVPTLPLEHLRTIYESVASLRHPARVIGIAMNSRGLSAAEAARERQRVADELQLPVCDVYRDGADPLVEAVIRLRRELKR